MTSKKNVPLSIVIPTYNRSQYLERCLNSILNQDMDDFEIIVSDNNSTDDTKEMMSKYISEPKILYVRNGMNLGARKNTYMATKLAKGTYVFWLSDDDYMLPNSLSKIFEVIKTNHELGYIYSPFIKIDDRNGEIEDYKYCQHFMEDTLLKSSIKTIAQVLPATSVLSRQILRKDLIDWETWERNELNSYIMTILVGRILLKSDAYFIASELIVHTWHNQIYWEEFGSTYLDIQLFNQISYRNCMRSVFFDQNHTAEVKKAIVDWEKGRFYDFMNNHECGFDYLLKTWGLIKLTGWVFQDYLRKFSVDILLRLLFLYCGNSKRKIIFFVKMKVKYILKILTLSNVKTNN